MSRLSRLRRTWISSGLVLTLLSAWPGVDRADTVASLLGDFTINQYCGLRLAADALNVHYVVVFGQLPALRELHLADADGNGVTTQSERDAYVGTLAPGIADGFLLRVNGAKVPLHATRWTSSLPTEQGGFSLRVDVDFTAALPAGARDVPHTLEFSNQNYPGRIGWHEIVVEPAPGVSVFDTNAFSTSVTNGLADALKALPAEGPLDERTVHLSFGNSSPPQARLLTARADSGEQPNAAASASGGNYITRQTRQLVAAISAPKVSPQVALLALLGALLLGAVHALSPGHGKTIVGAYLIGSRCTPRHAAFLGATVTITHTLGVFALGFATLYASRFIVPERLFPILSLLSAILVLGMGIALLVQRGRSAREALSGGSAALNTFQPIARMAPTLGGARGFIYAPGPQPADATMHSHGGGPMHSHLPPGAGGEKINFRSLLALGISGGLVPCPSAMVLLLAAVALNKTAYGIVLVMAFSVGLAITLMLVGLAFIYARNRLSRQVARRSRWTLLLPVMSAAAITVVGIALCGAALKTFP
jgi:nickel/cobalt exporter